MYYEKVIEISEWGNFPIYTARGNLHEIKVRAT
jgi:hypothetical protein